MKKAAILFSLFALIFLAGCSGGHKVAPKKFSEMKKKDVLVLVNGEKITYGDFLQRLDYETSFFALANKLPKENKKVQRFRKDCQPLLVSYLINENLVMQEARAFGIEPLPEILQKNKKRLAKRVRLGKKDLAQLPQHMGLDKKFLEQRLRESSMLETIQKVKYPESLQVSEKEIDQGLARQKDYTRRAVISNEVQAAKCKDVLKKIQGGLDFQQAGEKYGEYLPNESKTWFAFSKDEIDNPKLRKWAFSAPVGSVGGPFEFAEGVSIVKILDRTGGTDVDTPVSKQVAEATLARITFRLCETYEKPFTREFVKKQVLKDKTKKVTREIYQRAHEKMRLEFPNGSNFWEEAESPSHHATGKQTGEK